VLAVICRVKSKGYQVNNRNHIKKYIMPHLKGKELKIFKHVGKNVLISSKASFHNPSNIYIGDNTRIDDFCVLSAGTSGIHIGNYIHIAVFCSLIGKSKITIGDFANISSRVSIYSSNDDYSGKFMTNPTIDEKFTNVTHGNVLIRKHVIIGSGSIILPNVILEEGVCIGALSLVTRNCKGFTIYAGIPAKEIKPRNKNLLQLEKEFLKTIK
jgi:galactoside O-acetyltransferase